MPVSYFHSLQHPLLPLAALYNNNLCIMEIKVILYETEFSLLVQHSTRVPGAPRENLLPAFGLNGT